jgi:hypothetical protein
MIFKCFNMKIIFLYLIYDEPKIYNTPNNCHTQCYSIRLESKKDIRKQV